MGRVTTHFETADSAEVRHLVVGHSQIRDLWNIDVSKIQGLNFPVDWISVSGGKVEELIAIIKKEIKKAVKPVKVSAMIWQNSITTLNIEKVKEIVSDLEQFMGDYSEHKVALPECLFIPSLEEHFPFITELNHLLRQYQVRNEMNAFPLSKVLMRNTKNGLKVRQDQWKEYQEGTGLGYHIADSGRTNYVKFILKFHAYGFDREGESPSSHVAPSKYKPPINHPKTPDARKKIDFAQQNPVAGKSS